MEGLVFRLFLLALPSTAISPWQLLKDLTKLKFNTSALQLSQDNFKRFCMVLVCPCRHLVGLLSAWLLALSLLRLLPWCVSAPSAWKIAGVKLPWFSAEISVFCLLCLLVQIHFKYWLFSQEFWCGSPLLSVFVWL